MAEREDERLEGTRGGAAGSMAGSLGYHAVPEVERGFWLKDRVRWGPVWAGVLLAIASQLLLSALGVAIGLARPATVTAAPGEVSSALGIWGAVSALISLFLGGLFAARLAGIAGRWNGVWNGVVVWALTLALGTIALSLGATGLVGFASNVLNVTGQTAAGVTPEELQAAARAASTGALWFLIWGLLSLIAAAIGGAVGARSDVEVTSEPGVAPAT